MRRRAAAWLDSLGDRLGITPWTVLAGAAAVAAAAIGGWWAFAAPAPPPVDDVLPRVEEAGPVVSAATTSVAASEADTGPLVVHVDGAVVHPGVHELGDGARVVDAVDAAGGLTGEADRSRLNLAEPLTDGQRIWVPRFGEEEPQIVAPTGGAAATGPDDSAGGGAAALIDLNEADAAQLEELPGVGPTIAGAIVRHREEAGPYQQVEDLLEVSGIGPARLAQIEALVTV